ncbi:hypothetical protein CLF_105434 [Clonorchis sinensis]|uniref:Uncharacterized protein n=1 Tax=Clonorchis sinensis TaxID=79923 RepID=H2KTP4_CLOSI|nr:hypothetical protein CLF_105434 [Clonorchis sinensis]
MLELLSVVSKLKTKSDYVFSYVNFYYNINGRVAYRISDSPIQQLNVYIPMSLQISRYLTKRRYSILSMEEDFDTPERSCVHTWLEIEENSNAIDIKQENNLNGQESMSADRNGTAYNGHALLQNDNLSPLSEETRPLVPTADLMNPEATAHKGTVKYTTRLRALSPDGNIVESEVVRSYGMLSNTFSGVNQCLVDETDEHELCFEGLPGQKDKDYVPCINFLTRLKILKAAENSGMTVGSPAQELYPTGPAISPLTNEISFQADTLLSPRSDPLGIDDRTKVSYLQQSDQATHNDPTRYSPQKAPQRKQQNTQQGKSEDLLDELSTRTQEEPKQETGEPKRVLIKQKKSTQLSEEASHEPNYGQPGPHPGLQETQHPLPDLEQNSNDTNEPKSPRGLLEDISQQLSTTLEEQQQTGIQEMPHSKLLPQNSSKASQQGLEEPEEELQMSVVGVNEQQDELKEEIAKQAENQPTHQESPQEVMKVLRHHSSQQLQGEPEQSTQQSTDVLLLGQNSSQLSKQASENSRQEMGKPQTKLGMLQEGMQDLEKGPREISMQEQRQKSVEEFQQVFQTLQPQNDEGTEESKNIILMTQERPKMSDELLQKPERDLREPHSEREPQEELQKVEQGLEVTNKLGVQQASAEEAFELPRNELSQGMQKQLEQDTGKPERESSQILNEVIHLELEPNSERQESQGAMQTLEQSSKDADRKQEASRKSVGYPSKKERQRHSHDSGQRHHPSGSVKSPLRDVNQNDTTLKVYSIEDTKRSVYHSSKITNASRSYIGKLRALLKDACKDLEDIQSGIAQRDFRPCKPFIERVDQVPHILKELIPTLEYSPYEKDLWKARDDIIRTLDVTREKPALIILRLLELGFYIFEVGALLCENILPPRFAHLVHAILSRVHRLSAGRVVRQILHVPKSFDPLVSTYCKDRRLERIENFCNCQIRLLEPTHPRSEFCPPDCRTLEVNFDPVRGKHVGFLDLLNRCVHPKRCVARIATTILRRANGIFVEGPWFEPNLCIRIALGSPSTKSVEDDERKWKIEQKEGDQKAKNTGRLSQLIHLSGLQKPLNAIRKLAMFSSLQKPPMFLPHTERVLSQSIPYWVLIPEPINAKN